ncbi:hypothetical protein ACIQH9_21140 [Pseudarthrobacter oxydans]|uniref:hypothetical protein n=1 Tax=Pseudarthrobacter oxydans TaxID=1671 RepID=UPI0035E956AE|nr:hypothetical protein GCM10017547_32270 [Pseudarthrobacter oxydans]
MTAPEHRTAMTFLRRAGLLGAVLALIAGIFGMHVLTTSHALHSSAMAAAAGSAHHESSGAGHTEHLPAVSTPDMPEAQGGSALDAVQCSDSGNCTSMHAMTAACTPSAKSGSLAAPLPGTWVIARSSITGALTDTGAAWSYRPGSPSPGELCISRT